MKWTSKADPSALTRIDSREIPLNSQEVRCFCKVRNGAVRLPFFLEYHREKGVERFFFIDNDSDDDTLAYLQRQPDVHVWHTKDSNLAASVGATWVLALLQSYGVGSWCLVLDIDEFFFYSHAETLSLRGFADRCEAENVTAVRAWMLDMYSDQELQDVHYAPGQSLPETCPYFDWHPANSFFARCIFLLDSVLPPSSLMHRLCNRGFQLFSVNYRIFRTYTMCQKFPFFRFDPSISISPGLHYLRGVRVASTPALLLHYKFLSDFPEYCTEAVKRQEHWNHARKYRSFKKVLDSGMVRFFHPRRSKRFTGTETLRTMGKV